MNDWIAGHGRGPCGYPASRPLPGFHRREITNEAAFLLDYIPQGRDVVGAEVGVYMAKTATILLHRRPRLRLWLVDSWELIPETKEDSIRHLEAAGVAHRATILHGDSTGMAEFVPDASLDYAFIDASKAEDSYRADCLAWLPKVRGGGVLAGHDWRVPAVPIIVRELEGMLDRTAEINHKRDAWAIRVP